MPKNVSNSFGNKDNQRKVNYLNGCVHDVKLFTRNISYFFCLSVGFFALETGLQMFTWFSFEIKHNNSYFHCYRSLRGH